MTAPKTAFIISAHDLELRSMGIDNGDLVSATDPLSRTTTRFIDAVGQLVAVTDPER